MTAAEIAECLRCRSRRCRRADADRAGQALAAGAARAGKPLRARRPGELPHRRQEARSIAAPAPRQPAAGQPTQRQARGRVGWEFVHVCVDDATRLAYVEVLEDEKAQTAVAFLRRAVAHFRRHGIRVERVMTDNGSAYRAHPRARLQGARAQAPAHPPLPPAHERQGGALHPHPARRLGLRGDLRHLRGAARGPCRLARLLQSSPTTRLPRPPTALRGGPQEEQPGWVLHLAGDPALFGEEEAVTRAVRTAEPDQE